MQIQDSVSIAANATNANVVSGNVNEFLTQDCILEFGLQGSATGLRADILVGGDGIATNMAVPLQNRFPLYPDDYTLRSEGLAGDRIVIQGRNTTAGALTLFWSVKLTPLS